MCTQFITDVIESEYSCAEEMAISIVVTGFLTLCSAFIAGYLTKSCAVAYKMKTLSQQQQQQQIDESSNRVTYEEITPSERVNDKIETGENAAYGHIRHIIAT